MTFSRRHLPEGLCVLSNIASTLFCSAVCTDVYEEFFNPSTAAQTFLREAAGKRVIVLHISMSFLGQILVQLEPQQKSGALSMIGTLADVLFKVSLSSCHRHSYVGFLLCSVHFGKRKVQFLLVFNFWNISYDCMLMSCFDWLAQCFVVIPIQTGYPFLGILGFPVLALSRCWVGIFIMSFI